MNIGIDIDDTINNLSKALVRYALEYNKVAKISHEIKTNEWDFDKAFGWDENHTAEFLDKYLYKAYVEAEPKDNSVEIIKKLKDEGNNIIIITARSDKEVKNVRYYSEEWLKKHMIPYDKLITDSKDKAEKCMENDINVFIDDRVEHCEKVKNNLKIPVYLFDSEYNKNHEDTALIRVFSWLEVYNKIKGLYR